MQCRECFEEFTGSRCSCGWSAPGQLSDGTRKYQGMKLCNWTTAGKLCNMIASGDADYCNWHHEWKRQLEDRPMTTEYEALCEWLKQFDPGGDYSANPGQWWADPQTIIQACHGFGRVPGRTEKMKYERYQAHWEAMKRLKKGIYSDKNQRLIARTKGGEGLDAEKVLQVKS